MSEVIKKIDIHEKIEVDCLSFKNEIIHALESGDHTIRLDGKTFKITGLRLVRIK